jgi:phage-related protein
MTSKYTVAFFHEDDGTIPVEEWLNELPINDSAGLYEAIDSLEQLGPLFSTRQKLFGHINNHFNEIKKGDYRVFYMRYGNEYILLHGFIKNSPKTPIKDLSVGERRYQNYISKKV